MLQSQKSDCGEYQAKHLSYSHVIVACKSVNVDFMNYVPFQPAFLLRWTKKKMNGEVEKIWNLSTTWS